MGKNAAIEIQALREVFKDNRLHFGIGLITGVELLSDNSALKVKLSVFPEQREIYATWSWDDIGPNSGTGSIPTVNDLVLFANVDGNDDLCFVIRRLSSKEDKIPKQAEGGHWFGRAKEGKKAYLLGDEKVLIGKGTNADSADPTEPLVLGNILKTFLTNVLNEFLNAPQIGTCAVGPVMLDPTIRTNLTQMKSTYLTTASSNIVSQIAFTERGE